MTRCLNAAARRSRVYWLTRLGQACRRQLDSGYRPTFAQVDWEIYGQVCFSHRAAVIKAIMEPLQPATIKRVALYRDPLLRMSANNVRDVIRFLRRKGVVYPVWVRRKAHIHYQLTEHGRRLQELLLRAEVKAR